MYGDAEFKSKVLEDMLPIRTLSDNGCAKGISIQTFLARTATRKESTMCPFKRGC